MAKQYLDVDGLGYFYSKIKNVFATSESVAITPEMYGAVGDGETDDTDAIQACIDAARNSVIVFGDGMYKVTKTIKIPSYYNNITILLGLIVYKGTSGTDTPVFHVSREYGAELGYNTYDYSVGGVCIIGGSINCNRLAGVGIRNNSYRTRIIGTSINRYLTYGIDNGDDTITSSTAISSQMLIDSVDINNYDYQDGTALRMVHQDNKIANCNINGCEVGIEMKTGGNFISNTHFTVSGTKYIPSTLTAVWIYENPFSSSSNALNTFSNCYFNGWGVKYLVKNEISNSMTVAIDGGGIIYGVPYDSDGNVTSMTTYLMNGNYCKLTMDAVNVRHHENTHEFIGAIYYAGATNVMANNMMNICDMVGSASSYDSLDITNISKNPRRVINSNATLASGYMRKIGYVVGSRGFGQINVFYGYVTFDEVFVSYAYAIKRTIGSGSSKLVLYVDSSASTITVDDFTVSARGIYVYNSSSSDYSSIVRAQIINQPYPDTQLFLWDYESDHDFVPTLSDYTQITE